MTTASENNSQIQADGSGDKIRTLEFDALQADGTRATVAMQVVVLSDEEGTALGLRHRPLHVDSDRLVQTLEDLTRMVARVLSLLEQVTGHEVAEED